MRLLGDNIYRVEFVDIFYRNNTMPKYHREYRPANGLILYTKGGHRRKMADGSEFISQISDVLYLPYGSSYDSILLQPGTEYYEIDFHLLKDSAPFSLFEKYMVIHPPESDRFQPVFKEIFDNMVAQKDESKFLTSSLILQLCSMLIQESSSRSTNATSLSQIQSVIDHIHWHFHENTPVFELARIANISVSGLEKHFTATFGMSPIEYRNSIRINHAKMLLAGGFSIEQTAYRVGFKDAYYFSKVFKKFSSESPGQYIKRKKSERADQKGV